MEYSKEEYIKHYIIEALFRLMKEYEYEKISVTDIVNKAGVGRATFYRHFKTKEEIIKYYFNHQTEKYISEQRYYPRCKDDYKQNVLHTFATFKKQKDILFLLHRANLDQIYFEYLNKSFTKMFEQTFPGKSKYEALIYSGMLFNVSIAWLEDGCTTPPDELAELMINAIYPEENQFLDRLHLS